MWGVMQEGQVGPLAAASGGGHSQKTRYVAFLTAVARHPPKPHEHCWLWCVCEGLKQSKPPGRCTQVDLIILNNNVGLCVVVHHLRAATNMTKRQT